MFAARCGTCGPPLATGWEPCCGALGCCRKGRLWLPLRMEQAPPQVALSLGRSAAGPANSAPLKPDKTYPCVSMSPCQIPPFSGTWSFRASPGSHHCSAPRLADRIESLAGRGKVAPLRGGWLRRIALRWLTHMGRRAKLAESVLIGDGRRPWETGRSGRCPLRDCARLQGP